MLRRVDAKVLKWPPGKRYKPSASLPGSFLRRNLPRTQLGRKRGPDNASLKVMHSCTIANRLFAVHVALLSGSMIMAAAKAETEVG